MTQPTGVFVRLPLSEEARELLVDAAAFGKPDDSHDQAILSIGKPVTGNELYPIGYISEDAIGGLATGIYKSASISRDEDKEHHDTVALVRLESAQAVIASLEGEVGQLREVIKESRNAIMSDLNEHSIVCTVWVRPGETLIDYIDDALEGDAP